MKHIGKIILCIVLLGIYSPATQAQMTHQDSLHQILRDPNSKPEQRRNARDELLGRGAFAPPVVESPQDKLLRESTAYFNARAIQEDSLVDKLIEIVQADSLVGNEQKRRAILLLAQSRHPKAYAFLIKNMELNVSALGQEDTDDIFWKATYRYLSQNAMDNLGLFPMILKHLSTQRISDEDLIPLTVILEQITGEPSFLTALLNLYETKEDNDIFRENKKNIFQTLEYIH